MISGAALLAGQGRQWSSRLSHNPRPETRIAHLRGRAHWIACVGVDIFLILTVNPAEVGVELLSVGSSGTRIFSVRRKAMARARSGIKAAENLDRTAM
jgi:hypothetical protein